jgi:hypothetical protein
LTDLLELDTRRVDRNPTDAELVRGRKDGNLTGFELWLWPSSLAASELCPVFAVWR